MHSYIFIGGQSVEQAAQLGFRAMSALMSEYPDIGAELTLQRLDLGAFRGALFTLGPARDFEPALFDVSSDEDCVLFCFGRLARSNHMPHGSMARHLLDVVKTRGVGGARRVDGSFSAILIRKRDDVVEAFTDLVGMRSLRCAPLSPGFAVASHDLALVAAGATKGSIDLDSLAACVACDWSIGGHPLIQGIESIDGRYRMTWRAGVAERHFDPLVSVAPRGGRSRKAVLDELSSELEHGSKSFVRGRAVTRFSLTAGKDSRAVLALLHAFADGELRAQTHGSPTSEDVVVAKKIARMVGVRHEAIPHAPPTTDSFASMTNLLALSMNGLTNAKRALAPLPAWDSARDPLVGGEGGEIYTGFFYGAARGLGKTVGAPELADNLLLRRLKRHASLRFTDPHSVSRIRQRLTDTLVQLSAISKNTYDLLDLFYLYERYALWGAFGERNSWGRRWTPFNNTKAIGLAFHLHAPIGVNCTIHELLVRRHLPIAAFLTPINGADMLLLSGPGRARMLTRRIVKELGKRAPWQKAARRQNTVSMASRQQIFATTLAGYLKDVLLSNGSVAIDLFGAPTTEGLISRHVTQLDQLQPLGFLVTAEAFRQQVQRLAHVAAP